MFASRASVRVDATSIFARIHGGRQSLVYAMDLDTPREVAMILPVPIAPGAGEDALEFIDLTALEVFFDLLDGCWPAGLCRAGPAPKSLEVRRVGSFEASFVPSMADFARLDPRFRLTDEVWRMLPNYRDWGFAVFRLAPGAQKVHPMAFAFPSRVPDAVYFPTVHVHDGTVHPRANFRHVLYLQGLTQTRYLTEVLGHAQPDWRRQSTAPASADVAPERLAGLVHSLLVWGPPALRGRLDVDTLERLTDLQAPLLRLRVSGEQPNADIWLAQA